MKTNIKTLGLLLMAGMALVACSSDDTEEQNAQQNNQTWQAYASVSKDMDTRTLRIGDSDGTPTLLVGWSTTEKVYAYRGANLVGTLSPTQTTNSSITDMSGSLEGNAYTVDETISLRFPRETVDYTGQDGTLATIAEKYDYAEGATKVSSVTGTNVQLNNAILTSKQAIVKFTFNKPVQVVSIYSTRMTEPILVQPSTATTEIYAALPLLSGSVSADYVLSGVDNQNKQFMVTKTGVTMQNGKYYAANIKLIYPTYVDLGLSVYWNAYNMAASDITAKGNGYAWGEKTTKETYTLENYKWYNSSTQKYTRYVLDSQYGSVDNLSTLLELDDVARNLGEGYRMPTKAECEELVNNCIVKGFTLNGKTYRMFISTKSAAKGRAIIFIDNWAIWTSTLDSTVNAYRMSGGGSISSFNRATDYSVRPVLTK